MKAIKSCSDVHLEGTYYKVMEPCYDARSDREVYIVALDEGTIYTIPRRELDSFKEKYDLNEQEEAVFDVLIMIKTNVTWKEEEYLTVSWPKIIRFLDIIFAYYSEYELVSIIEGIKRHEILNIVTGKLNVSELGM